MLHQRTAFSSSSSKVCDKTAEAYGTVGQPEKGMSVLAEALAQADKTGERHYEAEMYRLKGTLTLQSNFHGLQSRAEEEVEGYFRICRKFSLEGCSAMLLH
jgi:hypothetical protein